jgi:hypothetical protein
MGGLPCPDMALAMYYIDVCPQGLAESIVTV